MIEIVKIIQPSGQLDNNNINLLHKEVMNFLTRGVQIILIDFQDVTYIDLDSVEFLKIILYDVHNHQGYFYICSLNEQVYTTFKVTNNTSIFNPLTDRKEFEETVLSKIL
ncbi:putative Anti-sigma factor antagonist [Hyella patelloides LEGE 07179]|uniref:Putative Anti-sigma factor antagonist n=1 Tax=Hyella patelloides LEGE 07179 TaxID=945734 RepID=A0A563VNK5_9CYAN|nr:STAS domain-containing protein [Hyella patelloides]VEP13008.1 putative Anti-sigma factor antagonist [Hyella patelloides LEGE 07179]